MNLLNVDLASHLCSIKEKYPDQELASIWITNFIKENESKKEILEAVRSQGFPYLEDIPGHMIDFSLTGSADPIIQKLEGRRTALAHLINSFKQDLKKVNYQIQGLKNEYRSNGDS
jgi:hypothetical protein